MSKKTPSQDFSYKFEHHWGGEDNWYTKSKRWAFGQKFPFNHLALGIIEWLYKHWVDGKVEMEMASIDKQVKHMGEIWDKEDDQNRTPEIVETGVFGEEGWSISMSNENFDRGSEEPKSSVGTSSDEERLYQVFPDPWEGDWNDAVINWEMWNEHQKRKG
jgi:hypothetical protein